ncbi:MAG TPA: alpha/beta fold hydrolase [Fimbriimonas sp.]|nr:alpha/beta fold hydrolase [Fimbriimonas sp.]
MAVSVDLSTSSPGWLNKTQYPYDPNFFETDAGRMHYVDAGHGEPIVFIHGLPTWSFVYRHLIRGLSPHYRCIAPDLIGFGFSDKPADWSYSPYAQAMLVGQLIDSLGFDKVTLVVHDYGAPVGMSFAVDYPDRIKNIVCFNSFCWDLHGNPHAERVGKIATSAAGKLLLTSMNTWPKMVRRMFGERDAYTETFERMLEGPASNKDDRTGLWATAKCFTTCGHAFDEIWSRRGELVEIPFLFLWGMKDDAFGEKSLNKWWHEFPLADVEQFPSVGHFPMEEKPPEVLKAVQGFLLSRARMPYLM